jgi:hypothetical protein
MPPAVQPRVYDMNVERRAAAKERLETAGKNERLHFRSISKEIVGAVFISAASDTWRATPPGLIFVRWELQ